MTTSKAMSSSVPGKLVKTFENVPNESHVSAWSQLWDQGDSDLWDRGCPSPSLVDLIEQRRDMFDPIAADGRRKTALVPGCGRGYGVVLLALHGFDAYGLEISSAAVAAAQEYTSSEFKNPSATYFSNQNDKKVSVYQQGRGDGRFFKADFFDNEWAGRAAPIQFDLVYDYTFFCALPPTMRKGWGARISDVLYPGGLLVCLEFPLYKDPAIAGPPWGVSGYVYWDVLANGGASITAAASLKFYVSSLNGRMWLERERIC
ncbi:hypothetical protein B0A49_09165 [Cryomyces minteri]|uniref:Thiol methyltransferase 2 n=1 Tax=Cryomyces minteri TaxID=331657 RepID=A0A4U0WJN7_9PEZI|nr:hypothetical protein B0A49_09165 [Cryomyces minteri]